MSPPAAPRACPHRGPRRAPGRPRRHCCRRRCCYCSAPAARASCQPGRRASWARRGPCRCPSSAPPRPPPPPSSWAWSRWRRHGAAAHNGRVINCAGGGERSRATGLHFLPCPPQSGGRGVGGEGVSREEIAPLPGPSAPSPGNPARESRPLTAIHLGKEKKMETPARLQVRFTYIASQLQPSPQKSKGEEKGASDPLGSN